MESICTILRSANLSWSDSSMFLTDPTHHLTTLSKTMIRSWKVGLVAANKEVMYSPYSVSSWDLCRNAKAVALTVQFQAIDQSPPIVTTFDGEIVPYEISKSPTVSVCMSLLDMETCPLSTASMLTLITFFHSESANSGKDGELVRECLVDFGSIEYSSSKSRVHLRFTEIKGVWMVSVMIQGQANLSGLACFLELS
jgi:hypothetical protein